MAGNYASTIANRATFCKTLHYYAYQYVLNKNINIYNFRNLIRVKNITISRFEINTAIYIIVDFVLCHACIFM